MASLIIRGAALIDGRGERPIEGHSIWIEDGRIRAVGLRDEIGVPEGAEAIEVRGKFVIPGLMDANVHLLCDVRLENLMRYDGRYEELIVEAAQLALANGLTTVFDTWGPRRALMSVRDRIDAGEIVGSRIALAGNIVGFDGPFSPDFMSKAAEVASAAVVRRINSTWVENVGRHLMWLTPEAVAKEIRTYIRKGIDFVKYASNEHLGTSAGAFLAFSPDVQKAIVREAHDAGLTAQAHTMSVEGLRIAIEAGCDLIQHANITGPVPIAGPVLELMARRSTGAVVFPFTDKALRWMLDNVSDVQRTMWQASDENVGRLMRCGAPLLLATDAGVFAPEIVSDPVLGKSSGRIPSETDNLFRLGTGHFAWFKAMEEKGCRGIEMLRAATIHIARAYGKADELGTIEAGKIADLIVLDQNPLESADHYRGIHLIIKAGIPADRSRLPLNPILTRALEAPGEEDASYVSPIVSRAGFPMCAVCSQH